MPNLLSSTIRLAYQTKKPELRTKLLRVCQAALRGQKLEEALRSKVNAELLRHGFDGNKNFQGIGKALGVLSEVLEQFGLEPDEVFSAHRFNRDSGTEHFDIAFSNAEDSFSPVPVSNSAVYFQWYKKSVGRAADNYEVVAYLS